MHGEQGPQVCLGMRSPVHVACAESLPAYIRSLNHIIKEAGDGY